jgi:ubiquinone/menaquinone biosynthesis C-methylase UbiE
MNKPEKISQLIEGAETYIKSGNHGQAQQKLYQAFSMANKTQNVEATNKILDLLQTIGLLATNLQYVELKPLKTEGLILDIGGGGEGIVGRLNGEQVVAIDTREEELEGTQNEALKVVMDASDLKFLPDSFHMCTAFFSFMYIPKRKHLKVFEEVYRVLTENGKFAVWDVRIPASERKFKEFIVPLRITLPDEVVETGYGVKWQVQNMEHFKQIAHQTRFQVVNEWSREEIFHLEMIKQG